MSKNVQSDMQSEREALGHMLEDDEKELLDASDNDSSKDDSSIIDEDALSDSSSNEDISYHEDESEEDASSSSENESDSDEPPPPPSTTTKRPKRKEKAPPTPKPSRKNKKKPPNQKPPPTPPTTSTTRRPRKSGKPDCSILGCTRVVDRRGLCERHAYGPKSKCSEPGCTRVVDRRGLCYRHAYGPKPKKKTPPPTTSTRRPYRSQPCLHCHRMAFYIDGQCRIIKHGTKTKKCSNPGCERVVCNRGLCRPCAYGTKKCSVEGCTANAYRHGLCIRHLYPCSISGCNSRGEVVSNNGIKFCGPHARTEAPEAYAEYCERRNLRVAERRRSRLFTQPSQ